MKKGSYTPNGGSHAIEFDYEAMHEHSEEVIDAFLSEFGSFIMNAGDVLKSYSATAEGSKLEKALREFARTGEKSSPDLVGTIANQVQSSPDLAGTVANEVSDDSQLDALKNSAYNKGLKAMGLGVSFEAEFIAGVQYGAEGIVVFPYSIGSNYKTPWNAVTRTWNYKTLQFLAGVTAGLGLSFWLSPPESSTKVTGVFLGYVAGLGFRIELFGWLPATESSESSVSALTSSAASASEKKVNPFKHIMAFRIVLEKGVGLAIGWNRFFKSKQTVSAPKFKGSSFFLEPEFMQLGIASTLNFTITNPTRLGSPAQMFVKNESTLILDFPTYMSDCIDNIVHTTTGSAPVEGTSVNGLENWVMGTPSGGSIEFTWQGKDDYAWSSDIIFTVTNAVNNKSQTEEKPGTVTMKMQQLKSVGQVNVPVSAGGAKLSLWKVLFTANVTWALTVDGKTCSIYESSDLEMNGTATANTALSPDAGKSFYYIITSASDDDDPPLLTIIDNEEQNLWNMGYELEQDPSDLTTARIRAVMWKDGSTYARSATKYEASPWQSFGASSTVYYDGNTSVTFTVTATQTTA